MKIFLLGAVWTVGGALAPVALMIWDWLQRWSDPIDWGMVSHQAMVTGGVSLMMYWRKHKAWLMTPPGDAAAAKEAAELKAAAQKAAGGQ